MTSETLNSRYFICLIRFANFCVSLSFKRNFLIKKCSKLFPRIILIVSHYKNFGDCAAVWDDLENKKNFFSVIYLYLRHINVVWYAKHFLRMTTDRWLKSLKTLNNFSSEIIWSCKSVILYLVKVRSPLFLCYKKLSNLAKI